jgi:hypothetical protein
VCGGGGREGKKTRFYSGNTIIAYHYYTSAQYILFDCSQCKFCRVHTHTYTHIHTHYTPRQTSTMGAPSAYHVCSVPKSPESSPMSGELHENTHPYTTLLTGYHKYNFGACKAGSFGSCDRPGLMAARTWNGR